MTPSTRALSRGLRHLVSRAGLRGTGLEAAWIAAHVATYPLGVLAERHPAEVEPLTLTRLPPSQRSLLACDVEAAGTPILLIHGMIDNRSVFTRLRRSLRRRGFGRVTTLNYSPFSTDLPTTARRLADAVERLCAETGYERIHVVGHSLGGLVARYYVQVLGGDERVHTLVTMGTPHQGTLAARLVPGYRLARQLRPDSSVLRELAAPAPTCRTRFLAFYSDIDPLIVPQRNAKLVHPQLAARNVLVRGVGHMSLPIHGDVIHQIVNTFAHLDADGSTRTPGVTPIAAGRGRTVPAPEAPAADRSAGSP